MNEILTAIKELKEADLDMLKQEFFQPSLEIPRHKILSHAREIELISDMFIISYINESSIVKMPSYPKLLRLYIKIKRANHNRLKLLELTQTLKQIKGEEK